MRFTGGKETDSRRAKRGLIVTCLILAFILVLFVLGLRSITKSNQEQGIKILEDALNRNITICYAEEGVYPESLSYIKEHYGLKYDEERYFVDYQVRGANIRPYITVIDRSKEAQ